MPADQRAVGAHPRQNHPDAALLLILGQRTEEKINRQAQAARGRGCQQMQDPMQQGQVFVRRNHIDTIRAHPGAVLDLHNFHARGSLEQLGHKAFARRVKMLNDDKGHAAAGWHIF